MSGRTRIMPEGWQLEQTPGSSRDITFEDLAPHHPATALAACCMSPRSPRPARPRMQTQHTHPLPTLLRPSSSRHNVLSAVECAALVEAVDAHHAAGADSLEPGSRSQFVSHDEPLSRLLWQRVRHFFPQELDGGHATGLMESIALAKYYPGQVGFAHLDYRHADHLEETVVSRISFTLYLNSNAGGEGEYVGGHLDFVTGIKMDGSHDGAHTTVRPTAGSAAIFYQGVPEFMHYPNEVQGGSKHILRADVLYKFKTKEEADVGCNHAGEWVRPPSSPLGE